FPNQQVAHHLLLKLIPLLVQGMLLCTIPLIHSIYFQHIFMPPIGDASVWFVFILTIAELYLAIVKMNTNQTEASPIGGMKMCWRMAKCQRLSMHGHFRLEKAKPTLQDNRTVWTLLFTWTGARIQL